MKTKEELNALKERIETVKKKLADLNEDELAQIAGGGDGWHLSVIKCPKCGWLFNVMIDNESRLICGGMCEQCGWDPVQLRD